MFNAFIATSLDGYIARQDGSIDWLDCGVLPGEDFGYGEFYRQVDALIMGSGTFTQVASFEPWPYPGKPVLVMSSRTLPLRSGCELVGTQIQDVAQLCQSRGFQHVYVDGGQVIQSFLAAGLLRQLTVTTIPILLGTGRPLFGDRQWTSDPGLAPHQDIHLEMVASRAWSNGYVQTTYRLPVQP